MSQIRDTTQIITQTEREKLRESLIERDITVTTSEELDLGENVIAIDRSLPDFPKDRLEDSLAVERALLAAGRPMDAAALARGFKRGGKRIEPRIAQALTTLVRYGRIGTTPDGRYLARLAA